MVGTEAKDVSPVAVVSGGSQAGSVYFQLWTKLRAGRACGGGWGQPRGHRWTSSQGGDSGAAGWVQCLQCASGVSLTVCLWPCPTHSPGVTP